MLTRQMLAMGLVVLTAAVIIWSWGPEAPAGPRVSAKEPGRNNAELPATNDEAVRPAHARRLRARADGPAHSIVKHRGWERPRREDIEKIKAFTKKHLPEEYRRLEMLLKENPRQARRMLRRLWWLYQRMQAFPPEVRGAAVARHRLYIAIFHTRREYLRADNADEKAKLKKKLRGLLVKQFDNDQAVKEYQVKRLAQKLTELKAEIEQRKKNRDKVISERLKRLLKPGPPLRPADGGPAADVHIDKPQ